jgi:hypothetical protein
VLASLCLLDNCWCDSGTLYLAKLLNQLCHVLVSVTTTFACAFGMSKGGSFDLVGYCPWWQLSVGTALAECVEILVSVPMACATALSENSRYCLL